jgi:hypothetical protein
MSKANIAADPLKTVNAVWQSFGTKAPALELAQNARRAGAERIDFYVDGTTVEVRYAGREFSGVADFEALLGLGRSNWSATTTKEEDPFGVGFVAPVSRSYSFEIRSGHCWVAMTRDELKKAHADAIAGKEVSIEVIHREDSVSGVHITFFSVHNPESWCPNGSSWTQDIGACFVEGSFSQMGEPDMERDIFVLRPNEFTQAQRPKTLYNRAYRRKFRERPECLDIVTDTEGLDVPILDTDKVTAWAVPSYTNLSQRSFDLTVLIGGQKIVTDPMQMFDFNSTGEVYQMLLKARESGFNLVVAIKPGNRISLKSPDRDGVVWDALTCEFFATNVWRFLRKLLAEVGKREIDLKHAPVVLRKGSLTDLTRGGRGQDLGNVYGAEEILSYMDRREALKEAARIENKGPLPESSPTVVQLNYDGESCILNLLLKAEAYLKQYPDHTVVVCSEYRFRKNFVVVEVGWNYREKLARKVHREWKDLVLRHAVADWIRTDVDLSKTEEPVTVPISEVESEAFTYNDHFGKWAEENPSEADAWLMATISEYAESMCRRGSDEEGGWPSDEYPSYDMSHGFSAFDRSTYKVESALADVIRGLGIKDASFKVVGGVVTMTQPIVFEK